MIKGRGRRVLVLTALLLLAAILWAGKFGVSENEAGNRVEIESAGEFSTPKPTIINGPNPDEFEVFSLPDEGEFVHQITCADKLYTVLVFPVGSDYRISPRSAVYNTASVCERERHVEVRLDLNSLNVLAGEYYFIVADQGDGLWYNPR